VKGKIKVSHDLRFEKVEKRPLPLKDKKDVLFVEFLFQIMYEPGIGEATLGGDVLYYADAKKVDELAAQWNKQKKLPADVTAELLNVILSRCNVKTLLLTNELNLPAHLPLPQISLKEDASKYIG
jgi:hypothetical protein